MTMGIRNLFIPAVLGALLFCTKVEARLSLLRISQWHDDGATPVNRKENLSAIAQSSGTRDNFHQKKMNSLSKMAFEEWKYVVQTEEAKESRRLSNLAEKESALRELLGFGYASASMSYSFDTSFSFSMSFPNETPMEPTQAPFDFDNFPDLSDNFSLSFPNENPGSPVVVTSAPSPSPVLSFVPTAVVGTPSTPTTTTSTIQVDPTANVDVGGKNSGPSSPGSSGDADQDDNQSVGGLDDEGEGGPDDKSNEVNKVAQTTMIAVLVAAAATVGTALVVRHWYKGQSSLDPASTGAFLSSAQPSDMA